MSDADVATGKQLEVLILVENESERNLLQEILKSEGTKVHVSGSGRDALGLLGSLNVDIVISDLCMKEMSGATLTNVIKAKSKDIYVILLTELSGYTLIAEAISAGANSFLARPVKRGQLTTLLQNIRRSKV